MGALWGSLRFFSLLEFRETYYKPQEDVWSFGQVIPLVMLLAPCLAAWDIFIGQLKSSNKAMIQCEFAENVDS